MTVSPKIRPLFAPQPLQEIFLSCDVFEVLLGGGRGAGKSLALLCDFAAHAARYGDDAKGLIIRRESTQLRDLITEAKKLLRPLGWAWNGKDKLLRAPNGAQLVFDHLWDEGDAAAYQGWNLSWIGVEEAGEYPTSAAIDLLRATLRGKARCYFRLTANPGGPGNAWLKARFVDPAPLGYQVLTELLDGIRMERVFIPCTPFDNPINLANNPAYIAQLRQIGSKELQLAWIYGQWNISVGQYFSDVWSPSMQVLTPFDIPTSWRLRRGFDWGFDSPSGLVFGAKVDNDYILSQSRGPKYIKKGSLVIFKEWYPLAKKDSGAEIYNKGPRLDTDLQGEAIALASKDKSYAGCVADPSIFPAKGSKTSTYKDLQEGAKRKGHGLTFTAADNSRIPGWSALRTLMRESVKNSPERPGLYIFDSCPHLIRTLPSIRRDADKPDDVDSDGEDHLLDALRYLAVSFGKSGGGVGTFGA